MDADQSDDGEEGRGAQPDGQTWCVGEEVQVEDAEEEEPEGVEHLDEEVPPETDVGR